MLNEISNSQKHRYVAALLVGGFYIVRTREQSRDWQGKQWLCIRSKISFGYTCQDHAVYLSFKRVGFLLGVTTTRRPFHFLREEGRKVHEHWQIAIGGTPSPTLEVPHHPLWTPEVHYGQQHLWVCTEPDKGTSVLLPLDRRTFQTMETSMLFRRHASTIKTTGRRTYQLLTFGGAEVEDLHGSGHRRGALDPGNQPTPTAFLWFSLYVYERLCVGMMFVHVHLGVYICLCVEAGGWCWEPFLVSSHFFFFFKVSILFFEKGSLIERGISQFG